MKMKGYGVVSPSKEDIRLDEPVIIKQGSKFGVKIRSEAPSIHMIRANIETEIAPIVGNEKQAEDLADTLKKRVRLRRASGEQIFSERQWKSWSWTE